MVQKMRIDSWRFARNKMRQAELAQRTGIDQGLLSKFERGYRVPRPEQQLKIAKALGIAPDMIDFAEKK
jgi:transcriptional regulator with XRE-family HTH domain